MVSTGKHLASRRKAKADYIADMRRRCADIVDQLGIRKINRHIRNDADREFGKIQRPTTFQSCGLERSQYEDHSISSYSCDDDGGGREVFLLDGPWLDWSDEDLICHFGLQYYYGGPGRLFGRGYIYRGNHSILIERTWALDI